MARGGQTVSAKAWFDEDSDLYGLGATAFYPVATARSVVNSRNARPPLAFSTGSAASTTAFVATGSWIFYNTHVLNPYVTRLDRQRDQAEGQHRADETRPDAPRHPAGA